MTTLIDQLIRHEGLKLKAYRCTAGKLTIGVGRNIDDTGLAKEEAMYLLQNDISRCMAECRDAFPFFDNLCEARQDVLLNMCFNVGIFRLKGFKRMIEALRAGNYIEAAKQMIDSQWAVQVGQRAKELADQMLRG